MNATGGQAPRIAIVTPVYDDWSSCLALLERLAPALAELPVAADLVIVDDGSSAPAPVDRLAATAGAGLRRLELVQLASNLGHQRAIAVGIGDLAGRADRYNAVLIMDCDGEDRPEDAVRLLQRHLEPDACEHVVVAQRARRSESFGFRAGYALYKLIFRALTGQRLNFGNFMLLPAQAAHRLAHSAHLWNHLAASVLRERWPVTFLRCARGARLDGRSTMNLPRLVAHGLSAVSVFADVALARVLVATIAVAAVAVCGLGVVLTIRFFTELAIPGWATTVWGFLLLLLSQIIGLAITTILAVLSGRTNTTVLPLREASVHIAQRRVLVDHQSG